MIVDDKLMKYVIFQKRTEAEVRKKCLQLKYSSEYIDEIVDYLKEGEYINDEVYVQKYIKSTIKIKNTSIFELKIALMRKGVDDNIIDSYINSEYDLLEEHEIESAKKILEKKKNDDIEKVKKYLRNKGYMNSSIKNAIDNIK